MVVGTNRKLKKVTILVSDPDPYATESSGDESDPKKLKGVVGEVYIHQSAIPAALTGKPKALTGRKRSPVGVSGLDLGSGSGSGSGSDSGQVPKTPGVRLRKWGKWCAEIRNALIGKRVWLGTFDTFEEASQVYAAKKQEFEILKAKLGITKKKNKKNSLGRRTSKKQGGGGGGGFEESKVVSQCEESEVVVVAGIGDVQSSDSGSGEEKNNKDDDYGKMLGEWVKMPDGSEVNVSVKDGIPIIDNYGRLLGEFRQIDDDLWLCGRPADDN